MLRVAATAKEFSAVGKTGLAAQTQVDGDKNLTDF